MASKKVVKKSKKIEYVRHNYPCNACMNYASLNSNDTRAEGCFFLLRKFPSIPAAMLKGDNRARAYAINMIKSVFKEMGFEDLKLDTLDIARMNSEYSCPFHSKLEKGDEFKDADYYDSGFESDILNTKKEKK
jgi:hypothetical protein